MNRIQTEKVENPLGVQGVFSTVQCSAVSIMNSQLCQNEQMSGISDVNVREDQPSM